MGKSLRYAAASAAFISMFSVAGMALAAGPVCTVPGDFATIQGAVNDAGCTTINVAAGTYAEHVTVNRAVTINGANVGIAGNGVRVPESVITGDAIGALQITADGVTINGFKIMGGTNALGAGVHISSTASGYLLTNNIVTGNQIGIYANSDGASTISNNLITANNLAGSSGGAGIYSEFTNALTINNNEITGHTTNNPIIFAATAAGVHQNDVISNNNIHDNNCGCSAVYALGMNNASFTGNTISAQGSNIRLGGADATVAISKNILSGGTVGVNIIDDGFLLGPISGVTVNRNSITGHTDFGVSNTGQTAAVDATCNWWGAANGPGPVGPGSGDKVTTNVTFTPWLTSNNLAGPCTGGAAPTTADQCKNGGWMTLKDDQGHSFKNQGDCVSFVATKGKNKGAGQ
jgi:parallel beta-helix repeat protein